MAARSSAGQPSPPGEARRRGRGRPAVGRDTPLTVDELLDRALHIVDHDGVDALSMRRLAADLGVTVRALYNHVPDKAAVLDALVDRVWMEIVTSMPENTGDLFEWQIEFLLRTRRTWLDNLELASMAVAVAEPDEQFIANTQLMTAALQAIGFPDVPLAFHALQTFTMGSVAVAASRRRASAYFGRDPDRVRASALASLDRIDAGPEPRGVVDARFDHGDEAHFETGLRLLAHALFEPDRA